MDKILQRVRVEVNENIYLKDPFSSDLGVDIVQKSMDMMLALGFENFTFKKLAQAVGCTEAAIYRYFENKHKLLLYLFGWYWGFLEQNLVYCTANLTSARQKLEIAIELLAKGPIFSKNDFIDPVKLRRLLTDESTKAIMTKEVDKEQKLGFFHQYYKLGERIAELISAYNPEYEFPKTLVTTIMEASLMQTYYENHLPGLTEKGDGHDKKVIFFNHLVFKTIAHES
ncbi:TetR/AcrR family transcriptional regulator [Mongoliitalea daihaiensis]|uniref:TetR/AcrR family transcriptional regulator n=1 Tax=Mongoliitalea daihaiensis TaxID=2782006 RepID=UPI001F446816|nr:TetR/AcrR family transcriptional regulator [Mongoliitalea daihaiensis]UJP64348.1 TetR/AcrR family transcriptional regulator [Mongoliitalea daihaiensis]